MKWKMPKWMEPYRNYFVNTGGNSVEDLMKGRTDPVINLPLSTLEFGMKSQVSLLCQLHQDGLLAFMNRLNQGNPHYTPYQVEAKK
jgi:hypothetical protein